MDTQSGISVDISVIIVNYKSWGSLENCLASLVPIDQFDFTFEVIIVDNQSNDQKLDTFRIRFPKFKFILNTGNNGFSNGCNLGADSSNGLYLLFLNPDTIANKTALLEMLNYLKSHPECGIASCTNYDTHGKPEDNSLLFPSLLTLFGIFRALYKVFHNKDLESKLNNHKKVVFPDWVSGSVIFMSKIWYHKVQGWSEDYWLYMEDVDLCKKVTDSGGVIALIKDAKIIHNHGGASRRNLKTSALTKAEVIISKHVYIQNHFSKFERLLSHFLLILSNLPLKALLAVVGVLFFFIPKLFLQFLLFKNLLLYYFNVLKKGTWLNPRAPNYLK